MMSPRQEDTFIPTMSCQETLEFYAAMTLPQRMARTQRMARVAEALAAVGLSAAASTLVSASPEFDAAPSQNPSLCHHNVECYCK